ncbi:MAG: PEP-CTERM sorting domain-containing protein [Candidatus Acidiferrales bacterium]
MRTRILRTLWVALAVAALGQVARADEIDTVTVNEATVQGFIPGTQVPATIVAWLIVGETEDFDTNTTDIFELFRINEVPGETAKLKNPFVDCPPGSPANNCDTLFLVEYPTTLPPGINLSSTVQIPEAPEPTSIPEPATLGMLGSGLAMIAWWIRRKARKSSEEMAS